MPTHEHLFGERDTKGIIQIPAEDKELKDSCLTAL